MSDLPRSIADRKRKSLNLVIPDVEDLIDLEEDEPTYAIPPHVEVNIAPPEPDKKINQSHNVGLMNYDRSYVATRILSNYNHANSRSSILITEDFKDKLDLLSGISGTNICCLVNNILALFLSDESQYNVNTELRGIIQKQHSKLIHKL